MNKNEKVVFLIGVTVLLYINICAQTFMNTGITDYIYPPYNVLIDTTTNILTWKKPVLGPISCETFEDDLFPPEGWQIRGGATGGDYSWWRTNSSIHEFFPVPPGDGYYAVAYTEFGSSGYHPLDFLITPKIDLSNSDSYKLIFDQYYTGYSGHSAYIEYSYDNGNTWDTIAEMETNNDWNRVIIDLSSLSGSNSDSLFLNFHSSDHNEWGSGWAIDNISIIADTLDVMGYNILLNSSQLFQLGPDDTSFFFDNLVYGDSYNACINVIYESAYSEDICVSWNSGFLHPVMNFNDNYIHGNRSFDLLWHPPCVTNTDSVPVGLVSFILYQDNVCIDSIEYSGQQSGEIFHYYFDSLSPGEYKYDIEACYDLSEYGYSGLHATSAKETNEIYVSWGCSMPFIETWDINNDNSWIFDNNLSNWSIDNDYGNSAPSAKFDKLPLMLESYESSLTSTFIKADSLSIGEIVLSFDLKLLDKVSNGTEKMIVEIDNGQGWTEVVMFSNNGNIPFANFEYNVTDLCLGKFFRIRFTAKGEKTNNIFKWVIDNITFRRICPQPRNITAEVDWFSFNNPANKIEWVFAKNQLINSWIYYGNGQNANQYGEDTITWIAIKYMPDILASLGDCEIKKVRYLVADTITSAFLLIAKDNEIGSTWPPSICEEVTERTKIGDWTVIDLGATVPIDIEQPLWVILFLQTRESSKTPVSTDNTPALVGYGNLIGTSYWDSWKTIDQYGVSGNLNLQCYFKSISNENINNPFSTVYYLYRMDESTYPNYVLYDSIPSSINKFYYVYYDTVPNVSLLSDYYYKVTAVNKSIVDYCESLPALSQLNPEEDFVYVFLEGNNEITIVNNDVIVFPNPAKEKINIASQELISSITLYNISGNVVFTDDNIHSVETEINLHNIIAGIYMINIKTKSSSLTRKVIVAK